MNADTREQNDRCEVMSLLAEANRLIRAAYAIERQRNLATQQNAAA